MKDYETLKKQCDQMLQKHKEELKKSNNKLKTKRKQAKEREFLESKLSEISQQESFNWEQFTILL